MDSQEFNKSFDELMSFLQRQTIIQTTKLFLEQYGVDVPVRKFLSFFMIFYQKEHLLDNHHISQELFKQVKRCIKVYDSLKNDYKEFKIPIFHYVVQETVKWFDIWKKKDKYELIMPMVHMYHYLENNKTNSQEWNKELDKQKELIKSKILKLDSNAQEIIDNPPRVEINKDAKDNIVNIIHKAYWDKFQDSIKNKQWEQLIGFVEEIKTMFKELVPHRLDLHNEMDNQFDIEILKQRLENNVLNQNDIFIMMEYIVNWIRQFQAPVDDKDTEEWWIHIKNQTSWDIMMRDFFMITFAKLDKIKQCFHQLH